MVVAGGIVKTWSATQATVAQSSGEAELYAATKGAAEGLGMVFLTRDLGWTAGLRLLVDTAAGHPTCGGSYLEVLEKGLNTHGIKSVIISFSKASIPTKARGVGGTVQTKEVMLIPMRLDNATVFVELLVLKNEVPPLLSVTLLD